MWTRRQWLAGAAATLLAAPFAQVLAPGRARADGTARNLLIFFSPNGTVHHLWRPQRAGDDFVLRPGSMLEPLAPYKDHLVIMEGLDIFTGNNHSGGMAAMLTNQGGSGTVTAGMSLDQYVAAHIGAQSRFASLEYGVLTDIWGSSTQTRMCYQGPGMWVHPDADPRRAYGRMFGELDGDVGVAARRQARRQSVLDIANAELRDLRGRLGTQERLKLDAHMESLAQVERSLFSDVDCQAPTAPEQLNPANSELVPALTRSQIDLAIAALSCGMTRVASVQLSHTVSPVVFSWVGNTQGHHTLSHSDDHNTSSLDQLVAAERWIAQQFGYLLGRLLETPSPHHDGNLLDDTVVLWAKEMGDSRAHVCTSVPFVLAGGGFQGNRYLEFDGVSHSKLLVSICQAFGLENQTFGDPTTGLGPLEVL